MMYVLYRLKLNQIKHNFVIVRSHIHVCTHQHKALYSDDKRNILNFQTKKLSCTTKTNNSTTINYSKLYQKRPKKAATLPQ